MNDYKLDFDRNHPIFTYSFAFLSDPRIRTKEYRLLMYIANNPELLTEFQSMVFKHVKEHEKPNECLFCLIAILW